MALDSQATREPLFVAGATQSGTGSLRAMLARHPGITMAGEFDWIFDYRPRVHDAPVLREYHAWLADHQLTRTYDLRIRRSLDGFALIQDLYEQMSGCSRRDAACRGAVAHKHYDSVLNVWPNARFIHIVRDGRAVAASWLRLGWEGNAWACAHKWHAELAAWDRVRRRIPAHRRLEVRFEDLLSDAEAVIGQVCEFLELPFEMSMLGAGDAAHGDAMERLRPEAWRTELAPWDVRVVEAVAASDLVEWGYGVSGLPPLAITPAMRLALDMQRRLVMNASRMRRVGPGLWLGEHVARRLGLRRLQRSVQLRMNTLTDTSAM